jgi:hypothetical protein
LVRPVGVVFVPERVHGGLRRLQVGPDLNGVEELALQTLVEPLHLPGRGGVRGLVLRAMTPFSRQIRSNITSTGR